MSKKALFQSKYYIIALASFIILSMLPQKMVAQSVTVDATIDSLQILIGKQAKIKLQVSFGANLKPILPHPTDSLVRGVEILEIKKPNIEYLNNKQRILVTQEYVITSFDAGLYYIPPFKVNIGAKIYSSKPLALKVITIPVDIKHPDQYFPQKDVMNPPFDWADWKMSVILSMLLVPMLFIVLFFIIRLRDNKPIIKRIKVEHKLPPHQQAMNEIERIKTEKSWNKGLLKEYYTELTDVLRTYIQDIYGFNAMEMTSSEIMDKLIEMKDKESISNLRFLFQTADLVKFAKHAPMMNENDANLLNAIAFIDETKIVAMVETKPIPEEITIVDKHSSRAKVLLISGITVLSIMIIAILLSIGIKVFDLFF